VVIRKREVDNMTDFLTPMLMRVHMRVQQLRDGEEGQAAVEYGVLVALIIAIAVGVIATLGTDVKAAFQTVVDAL
jgi:pilus assembly protein Flp/PilA